MDRKSISLNLNGFIIKALDEDYSSYLGIEGGNWPLDKDNLDNNTNYLIEYYKQYIDKSWADDEIVDVCNDLGYVNSYLKACNDKGIETVVLLCETSKSNPIIQENLSTEDIKNFNFIGYDYAYPGGSYYSCVYNDVYVKRIPQFHHLQLNEYGLFKSLNDLNHFIDLRNILKRQCEPLTFEEGDFIIYKVWKYIGGTPIIVL